MPSENKTPAIRFAGFTGEWEQDKFGNLIQSLPYKPFIRSSEIDGTYAIIQQGNEPIVGYADGTPCEDYRDVIIFGDHTLSLYKPRAPFFVSTDGVRIIKSKTNQDAFFMLYLLEKNMPKSEGYKRYFAILCNQMCSSSSNLKEQQRLGLFFRDLDTLITLHRRKCELLETLKKSMLEKLFPKEGELVPELRFAGFTGEWEPLKLEELCVKTTGGGTPSTSMTAYWNGKIPWFQSSDLTDGVVSVSSSNKHISPAGLQKSAAHLIPANSIAIVTRVGFGKLALIPFEYTTSQDLLSLSYLRVDPLFGVYSIYKKLQSELMAVQGTSIKGITKEDLLAKNVLTSRDQDEQQKIGVFLSRIDTLLTLHRRKLELLQNIKKACLEKMFV